MNAKYNYLKVIQQNYGQGWEDVSEYETNSTGTPKEYTDKIVGNYGRKLSLLAHDLREYRLIGYPTRVIFRKELKTTVITNKHKLSKFTQIRRTIEALQSCYTNQRIDKETVLNCLNNPQFQSKYVNY